MDNFNFFLLETTSKMVQFREIGSIWGTIMMDKIVERHTSEKMICAMQIWLIIIEISHEGWITTVNKVAFKNSWWLYYQFYDQLRISYDFRIMSCYVAVSWKWHIDSFAFP